MDSTPGSLLKRLGQPGAHAAWSRFVELYTPLLFHWASRIGLQDADAADLVQDLFVQLLRKLPQFEYDSSRSFRGWLHQVMLNLWRDRRDRLEATRPLGGNLPDPASADPRLQFEEDDYRGYLVRRTLDLLRAEFPAATLEAFTGYVLEDQPAEAVATRLGVSVNAVYLAKSRVIRRLRHELDGLLE